MTYFKLDIPKLSDSVSKYKGYKKTCLEEYKYVYRNLANVEAGWNDNNSRVFLDTIKKDKNKITSYFNFLDDLFEELEKFKNNIITICNSNGYKGDKIVLKFDDTSLNTCYTYIDDIKWLLNDCLNNISIYSFPDDFSSMYSVYNLRNEIKNALNRIDDLKDDIKTFSKKIKDELSDSKVRLNRKGKMDLGLKIVDYNWKLRDIDTSKLNNFDDIQTFNNTTRKVTKFVNGENASLNQNIDSKIGKDTQIGFTEESRVNDLNKDLIGQTAKENKIIEDQQEITGLYQNIESKIGKDINIGFTEESRVNGLNKDLTTNITGNDVKVTFNETGNPIGLTEGIDFVTDAGVNAKINNNINSAHQNIERVAEFNADSVKINTNNISSVNNNITNNIDSLKMNNVKINDIIDRANNLGINK